MAHAQGARADPAAVDVETVQVLRAGNPPSALDWTQLWRYRDVYRYLAWRNLSVRYKQTVFGVVWAVARPLALSGVMAVVVSLLRGAAFGDEFPAIVTATLLWGLVRSGVGLAAESLVASPDLVRKVYFPRLWLPAAATTVGLVDVCVAAPFLIAALWWMGALSVGWTVLLAPLILAQVTVLAGGLGAGLAAVNVRFRDVRYAVPFLVQVWFFATPILYRVSDVPARWRWVLWCNPAAGPVAALRAALLGGALPWGLWGASAAVTVVLAWVGLRVFACMERRFADVI